VGYSTGTTLSHNELANFTYGPVSMVRVPEQGFYKNIISTAIVQSLLTHLMLFLSSC
jgi:hypothetical protein